MEKHFTFTVSVGDSERLAQLIDDYLRSRDALTRYLEFECDPKAKVEAASGD